MYERAKMLEYEKDGCIGFTFALQDQINDD